MAKNASTRSGFVSTKTGVLSTNADVASSHAGEVSRLPIQKRGELIRVGLDVQIALLGQCWDPTYKIDGPPYHCHPSHHRAYAAPR
ncbi:hypothetical protein PCASD_16553 [Puccinia coronata f. sp. avenae]|uniref:Uncharacterized protein n=1 Tax=Puccinia coronata f. sp. avenae TaxID=200324 RepID=A0A2N5U2L5_9BASI|nr:hypothetical protein PCASD_16553 [Puccinia coronata f. sp. avenae]